jgi:hypothetical protein
MRLLGWDGWISSRRVWIGSVLLDKALRFLGAQALKQEAKDVEALRASQKILPWIISIFCAMFAW